MKEKKPIYGFIEDKVFGWVMANQEFCRFVIQKILPELDIVEVQNLSLQKELRNANRQSKMSAWISSSATSATASTTWKCKLPTKITWGNACATTYLRLTPITHWKKASPTMI